MLRKFLLGFSVFDLILIALMACLGLAVKPIVVPLAQIITGPLFIPGGVVAGGFYMMWLVVGAGLVPKPGAATLVAAVQAVLVIATGIIGTHGVVSLATYFLPGVAVDLVMRICRGRESSIVCYFAAGIAANVCGSVLVTIIMFRLPWIPLLLIGASASLSGGLGGLIAYNVIKQVEKSGLMSVISRRG